MQPTVGRIVHYVSYGTPGGEYVSTCRAAIIAGVGYRTGGSEPDVDIVVLNPEGLFFNKNVMHDEADKRGGTWHWPEREGDE
jgi:hypothetical protein